MSHPDPIEIHDHVYGFRASSHVPGCPACAEAAERLAVERRDLRDALAAEAVEPPADLFRPKRRAPWATLAAAAGLLAGLIWLLIPPTPPVLPAAPQADVAIARLIAELKGPSPLRREIALVGLKAYGAQAHAPLVAAGVAPAITEEFQTPSEEDARLEKSLETIKKSWDFVDEDALKILETLVAETRLPVTISDEDRASLAGRKISLRTKDIALRNVLKLFFSQFKLDACVLDGRLRVGPARAFLPSHLPIRVGGPDPAAAALVKSLGDGDVDVRGKAIEALRRLDFAAEAALWAGLDAPDAEVAGRAAELLRTLYTPVTVPPVPDPRGPDLSKPVTESFESTPLTAAIDTLRERLSINFHITDIRPDDYTVTFSCRNLPASAALRLMLEPLPLSATSRDGILLVTREPAGAIEAGPFWTDPETARGIQRLLDAPEDEATPPALAPHAFGPLRHAARRLPEPARGRARARLLSLYKSFNLRLADEPTASYLTSVSAEARKLLKRRIEVDVQNETLPGLLRRYGIASRSDQPDARTFTFKSPPVSVRALLDALTRCSPDIDWRMEGEIVVFDTPGNILSAVER